MVGLVLVVAVFYLDSMLMEGLIFGLRESSCLGAAREWPFAICERVVRDVVGASKIQ